METPEAGTLTDYTLYSGATVIVVAIALFVLVGYQGIPIKSTTFLYRVSYLFILLFTGGYFVTR